VIRDVGRPCAAVQPPQEGAARQQVVRGLADPVGKLRQRLAGPLAVDREQAR
jgi:hypothetical protein